MDKQLNVLFKILAVAAIPLFIVGCASAGTPSPSLQGTWTTTLTKADSAIYNGQWEITFASDGSFAASQAGVDVAQGRYTLMQDQLVLTTESGIHRCPAGDETGTYKWSLAQDTLTLTSIQDECGDRALVLTLHPWSRKQ